MKKLLITITGFLFLVACQTQTPTDDLSQEEFDDLREIMINETETTTINLGVSETILLVGLHQTISIQALPANCRTIVAGSETDSDSDTIPDDVTYEFNAATCIKSLPDNRSRSKSGRIRLEDTGMTPSIGYRFTFSNFEIIERRFGVLVFSETRNGTRGATLSANKLSLTRDNDLRVELKRPSRLLQTLQNQMNFNFISSSPIMPNQPFPAGLISINGTVEWTRGALPSQSYTITTQTPLQTDPTCESQRITGGTQTLTRAKLTLNFAYQPCGTAPIVSKVLN
jgi:hypothetical protein